MCFYLLLTQVTSSHDLSPRNRPLTDWTCPDCNRILLSGLNFTEDELYHKMIWESQEVSFLNPYTNMVKLLVIGLSYSWIWFKRKQMKCFLNSHLLSNFQIYNHHIIFRIQSLILEIFSGIPVYCQSICYSHTSVEQRRKAGLFCTGFNFSNQPLFALFIVRFNFL